MPHPFPSFGKKVDSPRGGDPITLGEPEGRHLFEPRGVSPRYRSNQDQFCSAEGLRAAKLRERSAQKKIASQNGTARSLSIGRSRRSTKRCDL